jgi:hypothetical protein
MIKENLVSRLYQFEKGLEQVNSGNCPDALQPKSV